MVTEKTGTETEARKVPLGGGPDHFRGAWRMDDSGGDDSGAGGSVHSLSGKEEERIVCDIDFRRRMKGAG